MSPDSAAAGGAYLAGLCWVVVALFSGARGLPTGHRKPWYLFGATATLWLIGDAVQRAADLLDLDPQGITPSDVCWLASYPLEIAAVNALIGAKRPPRSVRRDLQLDVLVLATAAALAAWHLLVAPAVAGDSSASGIAMSVLYPLGDVVIFSLALGLKMLPGTGGPATFILVGCLGVTLPLDILFQLLSSGLSPINVGRLDSAFLVVNGLLGAAALHPKRIQLTEPSVDGPEADLRLWRVAVLGLSLVAASVANAFARPSALGVIPGLVAAVVVSLTIVLRFYRAARAQELAANELRALAESDRLTGAANRELLEKRLASFLDHSSGVVLYIDLDGFKAVNDTYGHQAGDMILRATTDRLNAMVRKSDTVARIGGDEFVVVMHGVSPDDCSAVVDRVFAGLCQPITVNGQALQVGASVGAVVFPADPVRPAPDDFANHAEGLSVRTVEGILRRADSAMYHIKRHGGGVHIVTHQVDLQDVR